MSQKLTPITPDKLTSVEAKLEPVSERNVRRKNGLFYIKYKDDKKNKQFTVSLQEEERIAKFYGLDSETEKPRLRGRVTELIFLREIFELLWKYRDKFDKITCKNNKIPDIVRVCFHKSNHSLIDINIPFLDLNIDCKNKWTTEKNYHNQVNKINQDSFVNNARLNSNDLLNITDLQTHFPEYNLIYWGFNYSVPNKVEIDGVVKHNLSSSLLETSIKPNSYVHMRDIKIETLQISEEGSKFLPKTYALSYDNFMDWLKNRVEEYKTEV